MKFLYIILGIVLLIFIITQVYAVMSRSSIESYPYTVEKTYQNFEIRNYEARLFTSVQLDTKDYGIASSAGFSKLGGYIFGSNQENEKIAMTSPVAMDLKDSMTMMFMVPKNYTKENLPKPNQSDIQFKEEPAKTVAAITFGGWANNERIEKYKQKLIDALEEEGIPYTNNFSLLGYNPPYDLVNRKNEVFVELSKDFTL